MTRTLSGRVCGLTVVEPHGLSTTRRIHSVVATPACWSKTSWSLKASAITRAVVNYPTAGGAFDFVTEICLPLPLTVAAEWLGLDADNADRLRSESPVFIRMLGALADPEDINASAAAFGVLVTEFLSLAADRMRRPSDDLLSFIAADPALGLDDVVITAILIAVAGHETTANLLGAARQFLPA